MERGSYKVERKRQQKFYEKLKTTAAQSICIFAKSCSLPSCASSSAARLGSLPSQMTREPQSKQRGKPTVGSDPTSCVTPAVSPTALFRTLRNTQEEAASSLYWQVRQANCNRWVSGSSLGYSMFEHSLQKRKVICSVPFLASSPVDDAGEAISKS